MSNTYNNIPIPMDAAGEMVVHQRCDLIHFIGAEDSTGQLDLDAKIEVSPLANEDRFIPMWADSEIRYPTERFKVRWDARTGVTAHLLVSEGDEVGIKSPPAKQLITSALANAVTAAAVSLDTDATAGAPQVVAAANGTRQSVIVQNLGASAIYLGPTGVTTATGIKVEPGGTFTETTTTAAIYGVAAADGMDVRVWEAS